MDKPDVVKMLKILNMINFLNINVPTFMKTNFSVIRKRLQY